jgi:hypothetical protein
MNSLGIVGLVLMFCGMVCGVVAGILYEAPIQRYLEKLGKKPAHLLSIGGELDNYFKAKELAKKWGHNPPFLKRYGQITRAGVVLLVAGALLMFLMLLSQI